VPISGLGPHGERAFPPERVVLLPEDIAAVRARALRVAIVLHTLESDWAKQQLAGLVGTLGDCGIVVIDVVDCRFSPDIQIAALDRLILEAPNAIISLPVANSKVADAHARVSKGGIRLVLLDNVPTGLLPGTDYVSLISADNFGLGKIAAEGLASSLPPGAQVGLLGYDADFFVTNEREIAFGKWIQLNRPDVTVRIKRFSTIDEAPAAALALVAAYPELAGLFVVWDTPANAAARSLRENGHSLPIATVDLGRQAAIGLADGASFVAVAAQQPFLQGVTAARTTVTALLGRPTPAWVALPGLSVHAGNLVESFQAIWASPAPHEVLVKLNLVSALRHHDAGA
jgi:ribose transport system substrate-binding protein